MSGRIGATSSPDQSAIGTEARRLVRAATIGSLATISQSPEGWPYASLVLLACDYRAAPLLLLSDLAEHSQNIQADNRVSLLIDGTAGHADRLTGPRVSVFGRAEKSADPNHRSRFLARHESAHAYSDFRDFNFYRIDLTEAHFVAGFGRIHRVTANDFLCNLPGAAELSTHETEVLEHMNSDHADAVALYASAMLGASGEGARLTGLDTEGCDVLTDLGQRRLSFDTPIADPAGARRRFIELAQQARRCASQPPSDH